MNWFAEKRLVVPIDFSQESHRAVDSALQMADSAEKVHVVHVAPDLAVASPEVVWETHTDELRTQNIERSFRIEYDGQQYRDVHFAVVFGDPGHGIVDYAESINANVIVMPSHGRSGIRRLLIGSVAERVLRLAHCPVFVLRE